MTKVNLAIILCFFLLSSSLACQKNSTIYVDWNNGTDNLLCGSWTSPCQTLVYATTCALNGTTLALFPGDHYVNDTIPVNNTNLSFVGLGDPLKNPTILISTKLYDMTGFVITADGMPINISFHGLHMTGFGLTGASDTGMTGGGFTTNGLNSRLSISHCVFFENSVFPWNSPNALAGGVIGVVCLETFCFIDISSSTFYTNGPSARAPVLETMDFNGGTLSLIATNILIQDCIFEQNSMALQGVTQASGGVIFFGSQRVESSTSLLIKNSTFRNNKILGFGDQVQGRGGCLYVSFSMGHVDIEDSNFDSCLVKDTSWGEGGAIYVAVTAFVVPNITIRRSNFINNIVNASTKSHGAAIAVSWSDLPHEAPLPVQIYDSNFTANIVTSMFILLDPRPPYFSDFSTGSQN